MPSTSQEIRSKFMVELPNGDIDDGIAKAEDIIINAGSKVKEGLITIHDWDFKNDDFWDAIQYLLEEWDYAVKDDVELGEMVVGGDKLV